MEEAEKWMEIADKDIHAAEVNLDNELYDYAAFLSQQAAEKALKALYVKRFKKLRKIHDLVVLAKELGAPQDIIQKCKELTPAYVYNRYPDVVPIKGINSIAEDLIQYAREVIIWVRKNL